MSTTVILGLLSAAAFVLGLSTAGRNRRACPWWKHAASVGLAGLSLWLGACSWATTAQVIADDGKRQLVVLDRSAAGMRAVFYGTKQTFWFAECKKVRERAAVNGRQGADGEALLMYIEDLTPDSVRRSGYQNFGLWGLEWERVSEPVTSVEAEFWHRCHWALPLFHSRIGPYPVPPAPLAPEQRIKP